MARAKAAQQLLQNAGALLILAQISNQDLYAWNTDSMDRPSWMSTLFAIDYSCLSAASIAEATRHWLEEWQPDVVAINGWGVAEARAALSWVSASTSRRALIMSESKHNDEPRRWIWKEWYKRRLLSRAHAGLVGGQPQLDYLAGLGIPSQRIFLGYNAVDNDYFADAGQRFRLATHDTAGSDVVPKSLYFFACARFIARKNFDGLLRAYAAYRSQSSQAWPLVISGGGEEETSLRSLCTKLGLDDSVHWPGFVQYQDLPRWYGRAGAFIHPAKSEAWGLVVNEAAASSLPLLVAAPVGARFELVDHEVNGYVFDPFSDAAITQALLRLSALPTPQRLAMGQAAKSRVDQFGPTRFAQGLVAAARAALAVPD